MTQRVAIVGGGITGLAAAQRLHELLPTASLVLYEASPRLGGVLRTESIDGFLVEHSADNFITDLPWGLELCRRLGIAEELQSISPVGRRAYVVRAGRLAPVPNGFLLMAPRRIAPILTTPILSPWGKLRLAAECLIPRRASTDDESLASFARRRLGRETFERLVQPLISGIYTADPERLSMQAALPRFVEMERRAGSLTRAMWRRGGVDGGGESAPPVDSGARYSQFVAPAGGMTRIVEALAATLPAGIVRQEQVEAIRPLDGGRWQIESRAVGSSAGSRTEEFDGLCVALPAPQAAQALRECDRELADDLTRIAYAGCVVAVVAARRADFRRLPEGFGIVVPEVERRAILACSFSSHKYAGRAPEGQVLARVFLGGACHMEAQSWDDDQVTRIVESELRDLVGLETPPRVLKILRWDGKMPQYHVGHCQLVDRIFARANRYPTLALAGNAYRGVGVPQCVHSAWQAADRLAEANRGARCDR